MADSNDPNGRVTTREFYDALLKQNQRMEEMERRIMNRLDQLTAAEPPRLAEKVSGLARDLEKEAKQRQLEDECLQAGVDTNRNDIVELKIQSTRFDRMNAALAVVAAAVSGWFGASR